MAHPVAIIEVTEPVIEPQSPETGQTPETANLRESATTGDLADADGPLEVPKSAVPPPEINAGVPPLVEQPNDGQGREEQPSDRQGRDERAADQQQASASPPRLIRPSPQVTRVPRQRDADQKKVTPEITRPPVAVVAAPVGFDQQRRDPAATIVRPAVEMLRGDQPTEPSPGGSAVEGPQGTEPERPELPENTPTKSLQMNLAQVRSLAIDADLHRFHVDDTATCQVIRSGPNRLKLIGTGPGVARLSVWADSDSGNLDAMVFEVHVQDSRNASGNDITDMARQLNESVRQVYPQTTAQVRPRRDRLIVRGECGDRQTATDIVRMVRQSCLVPVDDELVIR